MLVHIGVPATRAGTPTERQPSTSRIERPLQVATPLWIDSEGLWSGRLRSVEYRTLSSLKIFWFRRCAASPGVLQSWTNGSQISRSFFRHGSRVSVIEA